MYLSYVFAGICDYDYLALPVFRIFYNVIWSSFLKERKTIWSGPDLINEPFGPGCSKLKHKRDCLVGRDSIAVFVD